MSRLNKELGLLQGIALLSTSLLGTGIFVVPALAATAAGEASLWAWMILIALVLPVAFLTTVPAQVLLGEAAAPMLLAGLALAVLFFAAARAFWLFALRFYTSASS